MQSLTTKWNLTFDTSTLTIDIQATGNPMQHSHWSAPPQTSHITHHRHTHTTSLTSTLSARRSTPASFKRTPLCANRPEEPALAPNALCYVAITLIEHSWAQLHRSPTDHTQIHFTYHRCVDIRFIIFNENQRDLPQPQHRHSSPYTDFFGDPVELEPVEDMHLLGFDINLTNGPSLTYHAQPRGKYVTLLLFAG